MHFGNQGAAPSWKFLKNKENKGIEYPGSINSKKKHSLTIEDNGRKAFLPNFENK